MTQKALPFICLSFLLVACTPLQWPEETFGSPGGYVIIKQMSPPADICDPDAFINGYRHAYMLTWNEEINKRIEKSQAVLKHNPEDRQGKSDYELYRDKLFKLGNLDEKETRYSFVPPSVNCEFNSYSRGKNQGKRDVASDLQALGAQRPK